MDNEPKILPPDGEPRQQSDKLWETQDVVDYLNIGTSTVYLWVKTRGLPCLKIGGVTRYDPEAVKQWVRDHANDEPADERVPA